MPRREGGADDITEACFVEAMHEELEAIGFRERSAARGTQPHDGLEAEGLLWGGNLSLLVFAAGHAALAARQGRHPLPGRGG